MSLLGNVLMRLSHFRTQAVLGLAIVIAVAVGALSTAIVVYRRAEDLRDQRLADYAEDVRAAGELRFEAERMIAAARGYLLTDDPPLLDNVATAEEQLDDAAGRLGRSSVSPDVRVQLDEVRQSVALYGDELDRLVKDAQATSDRSAMAAAVEARLLPRRVDLDRRLRAFTKSTEQLLSAEREAAQRASENLVRLALGIGGGGAALALLLAWIVARRLDILYAREMEATARAEHAVVARDEMLAIVAHDLRTPLSAMIMKATLIRHTDTIDQMKGSAEAIERVGMRMEFLIKSLLDAASIEAGRFAIVPEQCVVAHLVESTLDMFRGLATPRSIKLESQVEPPNMAVWCDRERIIQVLSNLLANALKFTPKGGTISLCVRRGAQAIEFEVRDTGVGIAPEHLERVFDRYWRPQGGGGRGAGLGLYIVKGIVEAHGGHVSASSQRGQGSSFQFELPVMRSAPFIPSSSDLSCPRTSPAH